MENGGFNEEKNKTTINNEGRVVDVPIDNPKKKTAIKVNK